MLFSLVVLHVATAEEASPHHYFWIGKYFLRGRNSSLCLLEIKVTDTSSKKLSYRAEIDGLRAIAVVSVILYHAQTFVYDRDWSEGGYIGVDIFFVISGFLITRIILLELYERDSFSFLNFYERRARRILPILFLVIIVSIPFAWENVSSIGDD